MYPEQKFDCSRKESKLRIVPALILVCMLLMEYLLIVICFKIVMGTDGNYLYV